MRHKQELSFEYLSQLRKYHAAWRLLAADSAAFVASFLYKTFILNNRRSISNSDLTDELENHIYVITQKHPDQAPSKKAKEYIDQWSSAETAWLSQRYTGRSDTPEVDLTPDAEKALRWLENLQPKNFVGTESRLRTIFQLLKELTQQTETDVTKVIEDLEEKKRLLENQIERLKTGESWQAQDSTQIKERYFQIDDTANTLLSDFRQVEDNFRKLDRDIREKMASTEKNKGSFLDDVFGEQDSITESDQGRSFRAFWEFLIQTQKQEEFEHMIDKILSLPDIKSLSDLGVLPQFRDFLLEAGNKVYVVNNQLTNQLSKYLSEKGRIENKRILQIILQIEKNALALREQPLPKTFLHVDNLKPNLNLGLTRPLFVIPDNTPMNTEMDTSPNNEESILLTKLFATNHVDEKLLQDNIEGLLLDNDQITLEEILTKYPPTKGVTELVTYLKIAENRTNTHVFEEKHFTVSLDKEKLTSKKVNCPAVIFQRI